MAKFAYNNGKNASTSHTALKLSFGYYLYIAFGENANPYSWLKTAD